MIEARGAHRLRRGLRHRPDNLAVLVEDLDGVRVIAAVAVESDRVSRSLGNGAVSLGARRRRDTGEVAAPGGNQADAVLKAVLALLFHADNGIGQ